MVLHFSKEEIENTKTNKITVMKFVLWVSCFSVINVSANDKVFNSSIATMWASVIFTIPVNPTFNQYRSFCEKKSSYYCLTYFRVKRDEPTPLAMEHTYNVLARFPGDPYEGFAKLKNSALDQFQAVFEPSYEKHNFFVIGDGCCFGQFVSYFNFGFKGALLTPSEYFEQLTDYSEDKRLNYLVTYYNFDCEANIIAKIGFGKGQLKREHIRYKFLDRSQEKKVFLVNLIYRILKKFSRFKHKKRII